jgi:hypothetical protein
VSGFSNPLVGGGGGLVYPSIHSPNFVTGVSGWTINKDGSAEFDNLTFRGTFFGGNDFVISSSGVFFYNGAGSLGNAPIFSVVAPGVTLDPFGNTVSAVMDIGSLAGAHVAFDASGVQYLADSTGTTRIMLDPQNRVIEFFDSSGTGHNPALLTIASAAGNDRFTSDAFLAGFTAGVATSTQIQLTNSGGAGFLNFLLNNAAVTNGFLEGINFGTFGEILLQGPALTTANRTDSVSAELTSNNGSLFPATFQIGYTDAGGSTHGYLIVGAQGAAISAGSISAVTPGTGTTALNPATTETWHTMGAFAANYSHGSPVPAYKLFPDNTVAFSGEVNVTAGAAGAVFITLPTSSYFPTTGKVFPVSINAGTPATAGNARVVISTAGAVSLASPPTVNAFTFSLDNIRYPLDY